MPSHQPERLVREMLGTSGTVVLTVERIERDWHEPRETGGRLGSRAIVTACGPVYDVAWCRRSDTGTLLPLPVERLREYEVLNEH